MGTGGLPDDGTLNSKLRKLRLEPYHPFGQRVYRSLSWVERAGNERTEHEKYIFLWIAFNAVYAVDGDKYPDSSQERAFGYLDSMTRLGCRRVAESIKARSWLKQIGGDTLYGTLRWAELELLKKVFSRLFVLRNQLMHGSATESGFMNRRQVESGARILEVLVPTFLEIMLDNPHEDWGSVPYAVSEENRQRWRPETDGA